MKFPTIIRSLFDSNTNHSHNKDEPPSLAHQTAELLKSHAMLCNCGGIAPPIATAGYTYRCIKCDKTLYSLNYNLGERLPTDSFTVTPKAPSQILNMNYYEEAIGLLKAKK